MKGDEVMYNESGRDISYLCDIYELLNSGESTYLDSTTNSLVGYMKDFIDNYSARAKDAT